ncbi:hypothetical protein [Halolamina sp. C58]
MGGKDTAGEQRTTMKCLACGNTEETVEEHNRHLATADHPDKGEVWV